MNSMMMFIWAIGAYFTLGLTLRNEGLWKAMLKATAAAVAWPYVLGLHLRKGVDK